MSSARLPGKVVMPLLGMPLIVFMVQRVRRATCVDHVVVATSTDVRDDPLAEVLAEHSIDCFRGSLEDVLDRFYQLAVATQADCVIRLTGDCPLVDWDLIDDAARLVREGACDYASLGEPWTYPNGLDVEALSFKTLADAWRDATLASEREHVTPFVRKHPERFRQARVAGLADLSTLRWTVDYEDDLEYVRSLIAAVGAKKPTEFDRFDLYRVIEQNDVLRQSGRHERNEGYATSLSNDRPVSG
jgi:spore coat polysaccharide biosynthesis protein SpsF (cytidylyltransferase family)